MLGGSDNLSVHTLEDLLRKVVSTRFDQRYVEPDEPKLLRVLKHRNESIYGAVRVVEVGNRNDRVETHFDRKAILLGRKPVPDLAERSFGLDLLDEFSELGRNERAQ